MNEAISNLQTRRAAILAAAAAVFYERGFEAATTLEIARRAKTSKRALYALFASKEGMLAELIRSSVQEMRAPLELPAPQTREELMAVLEAFGRRFLSELFAPTRLAMYRLALSEVQRSGRVARELDEQGRVPVGEAMIALMQGAAAKGLLAPADIELSMEVFFGVLIGGDHMKLLLGVTQTPAPTLIEKRVQLALAAARRVLFGVK